MQLSPGLLQRLESLWTLPRLSRRKAPSGMSTRQWGGPVSPRPTPSPKNKDCLKITNNTFSKKKTKKTPFLMLLAQDGAWEALLNGHLVLGTPRRGSSIPGLGSQSLVAPLPEQDGGRKCLGPVLLGTRLEGPWDRG